MKVLDVDEIKPGVGRDTGCEKSGAGAALAGATGGVRVAVLIAIKLVYFGHKNAGSNPFFAFRGGLLNIRDGFKLILRLWRLKPQSLGGQTR